MWVHTVSLCPPPALPHALVMRRRLIDWGWRYDYLSSPPPSHPPPPLSTFSRSLPNPGHSSEGDKACLLHVYRFVLIVRKQADSLRIKDGGWAHQGPAAVSAGLQRPPARMIRSSLLSWLGAREAAFAQKVARILSVSPRWISRWINVNFVIHHKGLNNQTFLSQEPKKTMRRSSLQKTSNQDSSSYFKKVKKRDVTWGRSTSSLNCFSEGKKSDFPLPAAQKDNYICCRWWRVWLTQMTPKSFGLSIEKWLKSLLETSGATGERWRTVQTSQCQTPWHVTTRTVLIAPHIHLYTPDHSN